MCRTQCFLTLAALYVGLAHSWDIAVSQGDELIFYTNGCKTDIVHLISRNLAALAYDDVHNMILYVDKQSDNDAICGYILHSNENKCFIKRNRSNIHSIAFDPVTDTLFFTDTNEMSINWFSLKPGSINNDNGNLLIKMDDRTPTDIAVDSSRGYIYWINTNVTVKEYIERARFNGSEREVLKQDRPVFSIAVDAQTQEMYYFKGFTYRLLHRANFNGQNEYFILGDIYLSEQNELTVLNDYLYWMNSSESYSTVWQIPKNAMNDAEPIEIIKLYNKRPLGIAANHKIKSQIQGCAPLASVVPNSVNIQQTTECTTVAELFCVHGIRVSETSVCKCTPGYIGERCDVSVCQNYCLQGDCGFNDEGLPKCRCNVGYSGERCEVYACHGFCQNNGNCSLNKMSEPVCQCKKDFVGDRCEVSDCLNYCIQGACSFNEEGLPQCRCNAGYSGDRCEVYACYGHCLNNGDCSLNEEDEPVCQCVGNHEGTRCEAVKDVTFTKGNLTITDLLSNWRKITANIVVEK